MGAAAALSAGGTALTGFGKVDQGMTSAAQQIQSGQQTAEMDAFQAQRLADAATIGRTQAAQTDADMRLQNRMMLGNMMAVRAAANTSPSSPTGEAILMRTQAQGDQERGITVGNIMDQARESGAESGMYTTGANQTLQDAYQNAQSSLLGGWLGGAGTLLGAFSGLVPRTS